MHSHRGIGTTQAFGFPIWNWVILASAAYSTFSILTTTTPTHLHLQLLLVIQQTAVHTTKMVFAVARTTVRKAANAVTHHGGHGPGQSAFHMRGHGTAQLRHISTTTPHIHGLGPHPPKPLRSPPNKLFTQSRNFVTRIFNRLTAPGIRVPTYIHNGGTGAARSLHSGVAPTIKSGLSFHTRTALSSGPRNLFLPRPPSPGVRVATNVGLGTARNFSTARPIFDNLVNNVPVACRALYEADLDLRKGNTRQSRIRRGKKASIRGKGKEMLKPKATTIKAVPQEKPEDEIDQYFYDTVAPVTTYLFVPFAPTPSSRVPLPAEPILPGDSPGLLPPLSYFTPHHAHHQAHASQVERLFDHLDRADVWSKGVKCSAYGQGTSEAAVCTVAKIEFIGWTEKEVRAVIGESGTGWCALEEVRFDDADDMSEFSSALDPNEPDPPSVKGSRQPEPTSSLIMPTLDLSNPILDSVPPSPSMTSISLPSSAFSSRPMSPVPGEAFVSQMDAEYDDPWADSDSNVGRMSDGSIVILPPEHGWSSTGNERSWQNMGALEFSAQHLQFRERRAE